MDIAKFFKRNIVENKSLIFISIIIIFFIRLCFYYNSDDLLSYPFIQGYIWKDGLAYIFQNKILTFITNLIFSVCIGIYSAYINIKHKLIRNRTVLIYIFTFLLLSGHPLFITMIPQYVSLLLILLCIDTLFTSYMKGNAAGSAYNIGFLLGASSLFSFYSLIYLLIFWVGFKYMRNLNFKTFISSLLGAATVYWLAFFYFLWKGATNEFLIPFRQLHTILSEFTFTIHINSIIVCVAIVVLFTTIVISYATTSHHDKVQVRANISYIFVFCAFSLLSFILTIYDSILSLYTFIFSGAILLSHFFSLTEQKWKIYLFYIFISLYFTTCIYLLMNRVN